jgi:predicted nucleic acid-binding protein
VTRYLFDTTVIIDYAHGQAPAGRVVEQLFRDADEIYTCDAVVAEALSAGGERERRGAWALLRALEYVALDPDGARWAGESRRAPGVGENNRRTLGDALIAAVAWRLGATIVTRNPRDFARQGVPVLEY